MNIASNSYARSMQPKLRPRRRAREVESEPVSVVVVEAAELVRSCVSHLRGETGVAANWLYCRWRDERFDRFAERALRHVLCPQGHHVSKITYFFGHDEAIESERLVLLAAYLRALPADGTLLLVAPEQQQSSVLLALAVLQVENARKIRIDVSFVSRPALRWDGQRPLSQWTKITGSAVGV
jgi:hypothetical protein